MSSNAAPGAPAPLLSGLLTPSARTWLGLGVVCVIAGGFVAAATATAPTENGAWAAAYLVLVAGVAQIGLALGIAAYTASAWTTRSRHLLMAAWNAGNAAVIVGTLVGIVPLVDAGGVVLALSLAAALYGTRGAKVGAVLWIYRIALAVLFVSIPAGLILARV